MVKKEVRDIEQKVLKYNIEEIKNKILCGHVLDELKKFPDECIDCIITSPPYYGCREYIGAEAIWDGEEGCQHSWVKNSLDLKTGYCEHCGAWLGQLGLEDFPQQYIEHILQVCDECMRVLKKEGVFFLNLGDCFSTPTHKGGYDRINKEKNKTLQHRVEVRGKFSKTGISWLKPKQRLLIPFRVAIGLQERGYIVRDVIVWVHKLTMFPERTSIGTTIPYPVKDRLVSSFEYIFQIVKSNKYYFNIDAIKINLKQSTFSGLKYPIVEIYENNNPLKTSLKGVEKYRKEMLENNNLMRGLEKFGKKFKKGENWQVELKKEIEKANPTNALMFKRENQYTVQGEHYAKFPLSLAEFFILASCPEGGIVLDPFMGSGTVALVAKKLKRNYIGIEISKEYCKIIEERLKNINDSLF
ncbi:MAG: site-specific DNA-methyltransferase [Candidatus Omnitrophica bacterium]|nr:site-specific DNA-methyltransferase [Candidatus Omnitrophota bacterium]